MAKHPETQAKAQSASAIARQWQLLAELQQKRWRGTAELQHSLKQAGFNISLRTIQRDLNALKGYFPIENNGQSPQGWRWRDDAPVKTMPQMSVSQALVFALAEQNLKPLLPKSLLDEIAPWFRLARAQLSANQKTGRWLDHVRMIPATQPMIGPAIDAQVQDAVYEALIEKRKIKAAYQKRSNNDASQPKYYTLNPIALIQRGVVMYLLATRADQKNNCDNPENQDVIRMFAMHRFQSISLLMSPSSTPANFDLDEYIASGAFGFVYPELGSQPMRVNLTFSRFAGKNFLESALSEDQITTVDEAANTITVRATIHPTAQLVWWLRGFAGELLAIEPQVLAEAVRS